MKYENIHTELKKETSEIEITGAIPVEALSEYKKGALKTLGGTAEIAGFRKGHIPEKVLMEKLGEVYLLEESAEQALKDIAPEIIEKEAPNYVGRPNITITKLAPGNPVEFKIVIGIRPEITLPNYKKIAKESLNIPDKEEDKIEATEKDIDNVVEEIRGRHAHDKYHILNKEAGHDHNDEEINKLKPEFTDDFVKTIGNFESVTDFRVKAKENVIKEKEARLKDKKRSKILEQLIAEITIILPQALIDNELNRMFSQFEADVSGVGLKLEDYLKHIKKTPEELAKDWKPDAEKRAKLNLILEDIATKEKIQPEPEEVKKEVEHLTAHYKDVDPLRASLYVEHMLRIEKTINFLENQK